MISREKFDENSAKAEKDLNKVNYGKKFKNIFKKK
jgi:hypothetical protein